MAVRRDFRPHPRIVKGDGANRGDWNPTDWIYRIGVIVTSAALLGGTVLIAWALARLIRR